MVNVWSILSVFPVVRVHHLQVQKINRYAHTHDTWTLPGPFGIVSRGIAFFCTFLLQLGYHCKFQIGMVHFCVKYLNSVWRSTLAACQILMNDKCNLCGILWDFRNNMNNKLVQAKYFILFDMHMIWQGVQKYVVVFSFGHHKGSFAKH